MLIFNNYYENTLNALFDDIKTVGAQIGLEVHAEDSAHVVLTDGNFYYSYVFVTNTMYESYSIYDTYTGNYLDNAIFTAANQCLSGGVYSLIITAFLNNTDYGIGIFRTAYTLYSDPIRLSKHKTSADRFIYMLNGASSPVYYDTDGNQIGTLAHQLNALVMNGNNTIYKRNLNVTGAGGLIIDNEFFLNVYDVVLPSAMTDRRYEVVCNDGRYIFPNQSMGGAQNMIIKHEEV